MKKTKPSNTQSSQKQEMVFNKQNFLWLAISFGVVVFGFILMSGTTGDIYDFRRTTLAPAVVIIGFALGIYAIFAKKK
jgi:hypothetical protein